MYDVVSTTTENSTLVYYCFSDKNENQIIKKYDEINNSNKPTSEAGAKQIASFFTIDLFCTYYSSSYINSSIDYINSIFSVHTILLLPTPTSEILIPPPQFVV